MDPVFVQSLVRVFHDIIHTRSDDDDTNATRVALLKRIKGTCEVHIKKLEAPFRNRVELEGIRFISKGAEGVEFDIGDVRFRKFDDKDEWEDSAEDHNAVAALVLSKGISPAVAGKIMKVRTTVDVGALHALVKLGHLSEVEYASVVTKKKVHVAGRFQVKPLGALNETLEQLK